MPTQESIFARPFTDAPPPAPDETMVLADGRTLGYARYGLPEGIPVLLFHGLPGSRGQAHLLHDSAARLGIRLLCWDRPAIGLSSPQPDRCIRDNAKDVEELMDHLEIAQAGFFGGSGGTPYLLSSSYALPHRVSRIALFGCLAEVARPELRDQWSTRHRLLFKMGRQFEPQALAKLLGPLKRLRSPRQIFRMLRRVLPPTDACALENYEDWRWLLEEPFRQGNLGPATDLCLLARPWRFPLREPDAPTRVWHGDQDGITPFAFSQWVAACIGVNRVETFRGLGHYLADLDAWEEMLAWVAGVEQAKTSDSSK